MKKLIFTIPVILLFQSCSPSLSDGETALLNKEFKREKVYYYNMSEDKVTQNSLKVEGYEVLKSIDLTEKEQKTIDQNIKVTRAMGANDYDMEMKQLQIHALYKAPNDGMITAGGYIFQDKTTFDTALKQFTHQETHNRVCKKKTYNYGYSSCIKHGYEKVKDYDKRLAEVTKKYSEVKTFKKGDVVKAVPYKVAIMTEHAEGKSRTKVKFKRTKTNSIASK